MRPHRGAFFVGRGTGFVVVPPMETMSSPVGNFGELPAFEAGR